MEQLQPIQPHHENTQNVGIPQEFQDAGINLKNAQFLDKLGMKDELFNQDVMEKIDYIASRVEDVLKLEDINMRMGEDNTMPKIDKIFSYLKLLEQSEITREKQELINKQIQHYERS